MELVINTVIWSAVLQGVLLGLVFIFSKNHRSFSNKLLGFFLITFVFGAVNDLFPFDKIGPYPLYGYFALPEVKLLFPTLFLHFVLIKLGRPFAYKKFLLVNYLLSFAIAGLTVFNVTLFISAKYTIYQLFSPEGIESFFMIYQYCAFLITVIVFVISIIELQKYRKLIKNEYSDLSMLSINWLWQFVFIMAPIILLWGMELVRIMLGGFGQSDIVTVTWVFVVFFNYFVSYKAFTHKDLFSSADVKANTEEKGSSIVEPAKSRTDNSVCDTIKSSMETKQFYLDQNLSIHDFAKKIKISSRVISSCINQSFGVNFNEWVNNYRVEKALEILKDKKNNHLSIEGVGSDAGFKSRSAMYIAFKKKTGNTPGFFRKI